MLEGDLGTFAVTPAAEQRNVLRRRGRRRIVRGLDVVVVVTNDAVRRRRVAFDRREPVKRVAVLTGLLLVAGADSAVLDAVGASRAHIVGTSFGGMVAGWVAAISTGAQQDREDVA